MKNKENDSHVVRDSNAMLFATSDKTTYATILRRVSEDPKLKELGENMVRTRRSPERRFVL